MLFLMHDCFHTSLTLYNLKHMLHLHIEYLQDFWAILEHGNICKHEIGIREWVELELSTFQYTPEEILSTF